MFSARKTTLLIAGMLLLPAFMFYGFAQTKDAERNSLLEPLPRGNWSIVFHPYLGQDYLNAPVIVQSVSTKRLAAEKFEIQNISNKAVIGVKVRWILYENEDRSRVLRQGQTRLLNFCNELPSGQMGFIRLRVISLFDFYRDFLIKGRLDREFDIDLLVDEVKFADGSIWRWEDGASPDRKEQMFSNMMESDCAKQKCVLRPSTTVRDAVVYSCGSSTMNERCVPAGDFDCTNQSCNRPGGGGFEIEVGEN
jgi:hypothetical protein